MARMPERRGPSVGHLLKPIAWPAQPEQTKHSNAFSFRRWRHGIRPQAKRGAARRRIAIRATLLDDDPDLTRLADALASPQVRLLTRGRAEAGPTLEVAHEALLRVQPVKSWIEKFSVELKLRDEIEREASEWQIAETRLARARQQARGTQAVGSAAKRYRRGDRRATRSAA